MLDKQAGIDFFWQSIELLDPLPPSLGGEVKYVYLPGREDREIFLEVERCRW